MTILVKIINEDQDPTRGIHVCRTNGDILARLTPGQSTEQHVWKDSRLIIEEFYVVNPND